jgi:hypothetical protein
MQLLIYNELMECQGLELSFDFSYRLIKLDFYFKVNYLYN